jgi:hypothetical protein
MSLLEERGPRSLAARRDLSAADRRAAWLAATGWALTIVSLLGLPGPDGYFMAAAPLLGTASVFPALMAMWMQRFRGGFSRLFLFGGAAALFALGAAYVGKASAGRILLACFLPSVVLFLAAMTLSAARARQARAT